eukprot:scaffold393_cov158-Skeletonema_dohrnii-CCMP3373.AAC.8
MDVDEIIFSTLEAINDNWTSHSSASEDEMKDKIASQQEELRNLREIVERIQDSLTQMDQIASEKEELRKLEIVDKMLESNASAHSEHVVSGSESDVDAQQVETEHDDDIVVPYEA